MIVTIKIKKILCLGMAVVLAFGVTACAKSGDAQLRYRQSVVAVNNAVGLDMNVKTTMSQSYGEETNETVYESSVKKQNNNGSLRDTTMTVTQGEQSYTTEYVIDEEKAYVIVQQQYQEMQPMQVESNTGYNRLYKNFDEDAVTNLSSEKKDGKTVHKLEIDPTKASDFVGVHLNGYMMSTDQMTLDVHNLTISVVFGKNNMPAEVTYEYSLTASPATTASSDASGESSPIELNVISVYTINASGNAVKVTLPDMSGLTLYDPSAAAGTNDGTNDGTSGE